LRCNAPADYASVRSSINAAVAGVSTQRAPAGGRAGAP
jgi:hypothetical protein